MIQVADNVALTSQLVLLVESQ